ncbi:MarR family transcriptional repressor of emrRAB [Vogesella perlucida]|nr:MarR family transcriptional repressor of emrRAB [Vogesella perlucida]
MNECPNTCHSFVSCEQAVESISSKMPGAPRQEVLLTRLYFHLQPYLLGYFNETLKCHEINETTWMALMVLYSRPEQRVSPSELSDALAFSRTNATRVVDDLCQRGLIERLPSQEDRRKTELILTEKGLAFIAQVMPEQRQRMRELWQDFSDEERTTLDALLRKLLRRVGG